MEDEMNLSLIFYVVREKIGIIILGVVIIAGAVFGISDFFITPMYSASTSLYVKNETLIWSNSAFNNGGAAAGGI